MKIQVTLIGGPADMTRYVVDEDQTQIRIPDVSEVLPYVAEFDPKMSIPSARMKIHTYLIRQVDREVFVGIWQKQPYQFS